MYTLYLGGIWVPYAVDSSTNISAAPFLLHVDRKANCTTFSLLWVNMYKGYSPRVSLDPGSSFDSIEWTQPCRDAFVTISTGNTEPRNSMFQVKTYHAMLCRMHTKTFVCSLEILNELSLSISFRAMADVASLIGLHRFLFHFSDLYMVLHKLYPNLSSILYWQPKQSYDYSLKIVVVRNRISTALLGKHSSDHSCHVFPNNISTHASRKQKHLQRLISYALLV